MTTRKQSDERLIRLADLLESLPRKHVRKFDLHTWCTCGTTACAVGEATFDPWFQRRGLKLGYKNSYGAYALLYRDYEDMLAAAVFFGTTVDEASRLFLPGHYPYGQRGPKTVAKRIRRFVEKQA